MPKFKYAALDAKGVESQGEVEAESQTAALGKIREKGLFPTNLAELDARQLKKKAAKAAPAAGGGFLKMELRMPRFLVRVRPKQLAIFTRQLATLIDAGLPLLRGLQVLNRQERNPVLKRSLTEMAESIESGSTFAEALSQQPKIFNKLFINMVRAGELGGVLDVVLVRLADFMEKAQRIKSKIISAMVYPIVVMLMAFTILAFLMVFIVPKFKQIFADLLENQALPGLTQFVLAVSTTLTHRLPLVALVIVALVVIVKLIGATKKGRYVIDVMKLHMPIFGILNRKTAIARFSRTLGTLMTSGVPVLQALNIVRDTVQNEVIGKAVASIHDSVKEGENMAPPIEASGVFPPMVVSMVEVGEETGGLPEMLMKVADSYDDEVDNTVAGLTSIIEPILIIFLAVVVGSIVVSLFLPLISIIGKLSG
jgi:type IV pilus assembly protein PilC